MILLGGTTMSRPRDLIHPRDEIMRTMERIYRYRMTTTSGGNLSIRDDDGRSGSRPPGSTRGASAATTSSASGPTARSRGRTGRPRSSPSTGRSTRPGPTSGGSSTPTRWPWSPSASAGRCPTPACSTRPGRSAGPVGFAPYALPGSEALGRNIADVRDRVGLRRPGEPRRRHRRRGLQEAFERFETLEFAAKTLIKAGILGTRPDPGRPTRPTSPRARHRPRPSSPARRRAARRNSGASSAEFVRRGYQQRLMISTQGAFSARLDDDSFLITPHGVDRSRLDIADIVLVRDGSPEPGKEPSGSSRNHRAIYGAHPAIQSVVNAYPVNATAFGVTDTPLDSRTIPESYLFLKDVDRVPYGVQFGDGAELARLASPRNPILILENDGVQVWGTSVLDAFDRLEVLESTAEAMIELPAPRRDGADVRRGDRRPEPGVPDRVIARARGAVTGIEENRPHLGSRPLERVGRDHPVEPLIEAKRRPRRRRAKVIRESPARPTIVRLMAPALPRSSPGRPGQGLVLPPGPRY